MIRLNAIVSVALLLQILVPPRSTASGGPQQTLSRDFIQRSIVRGESRSPADHQLVIHRDHALIVVVPGQREALPGAGD